MSQIGDLICIFSAGALIAAALGALIASQTEKRLIPELQAMQIGNWRRFGLAIVIVIPFLQGLVLNELHPRRVSVPTSIAFAAILANYLCYQIGSYRWRKSFLRESWSCVEMFIFQIRFFLVFLAPMFVLLLAAPTCADLDQPWLGIPLGVVIWLWWWQYNPMIAWFMGARDLQDAQLRERLDRLAAKSAVAPIHWLECGPKGGSFANAFALAPPAWGSKPAVLITVPMLESCTDDEIEAVCAHEVAHLEDYDELKQKKLALQFLLPVILGCGIFPWIMSLNDSGRWIGLLAWVFTWFVISKWLVRRRLREETSSDRRAYELMKNPLHLADALVKINNRQGGARRILAAAEVGLTHPSLARRIGLIREAAKAPPVHVPACCARGVNGGQLTITQEAVHLVLPATKKTAPLPVCVKWKDLATIVLTPQQKTATLLIQAVDAAKPTQLQLHLETATEIEPIIQTADHRMAGLATIMRNQKKPKQGLLRLTLFLSLFPIVLILTANPALILILLPAWLGCVIRCSRTWMLTTGLAFLGSSAVGLFVHLCGLADAKSTIVGAAALLIPFGLSLILAAVELRRDFVAAFPRGNPWLTFTVMVISSGVAFAASPRAATITVFIGLVAATGSIPLRRSTRSKPKSPQNPNVQT